MGYGCDLELSENSISITSEIYEETADINPLNMDFDSVTLDTTIKEATDHLPLSPINKDLPNIATTKNEALINYATVKYPTKYLLIPEKNQSQMLLTNNGFKIKPKISESDTFPTVLVNGDPEKPGTIGILRTQDEVYLALQPKDSYSFQPVAIKLRNIKQISVDHHHLNFQFNDTEKSVDEKIDKIYKELELLKVYHEYESYDNKRPNNEIAKFICQILSRPDKLEIIHHLLNHNPGHNPITLN